MSYLQVKKIDQFELNTLATYMSDELREECHSDFGDMPPTEWVNKYIDLAVIKDPGFIMVLLIEFKHLIEGNTEEKYPKLCHFCDGSGQGMHDGQICFACEGKGRCQP